MARGTNVTPTETFQISTTPQVIALLDQLARTGLHGKNKAEVAEEMIREGLRAAIRERSLKIPRGKR